jgi:hypothetical protein
MQNELPQHTSWNWFFYNNRANRCSEKYRTDANYAVSAILGDNAFSQRPGRDTLDRNESGYWYLSVGLQGW